MRQVNRPLHTTQMRQASLRCAPLHLSIESPNSQSKTMTKRLQTIIATHSGSFLRQFHFLRHTLLLSLSSLSPNIGSFHCDEALGVALLRKTTQFANATLLRTRNEELLKTADIVLDVGSVYDADRLRFDHHQVSFFLLFVDCASA